AFVRERAAADLKNDFARAEQAIRIDGLRAEVEAATQRFAAAQESVSEALLALSNHDVLAKVAEAMSVQSFIGGKSLTDVRRQGLRRHAAAGRARSRQGEVLPEGHEDGEGRLNIRTGFDRRTVRGGRSRYVDCALTLGSPPSPRSTMSERTDKT